MSFLNALILLFILLSFSLTINGDDTAELEQKWEVVGAGREQVTFFQALKGIALTILVLWTVAANSLVFIVLYKNPRLQTVPNLLVGNLAFSDLCLGFIVLPLSSVYAISGEWLFPETVCEVFVSADILCSTASIWNLSIVGLDRYWAITSPVGYLSKRTKKTAGLMILSVWISSALISLAPLLGWKQVAGSVLFGFTKLYYLQAFAKHRARQIYRQKVIRKHIESTILHEISHVLPTSDEFAKEEEDEEDDTDSSEKYGDVKKNGVITEDDPIQSIDEQDIDTEISTQESRNAGILHPCSPNSVVIRRESLSQSISLPNTCMSKGKSDSHNSSTTYQTVRSVEKTVAFRPSDHQHKHKSESLYAKNSKNNGKEKPAMISYEKIKRHKLRKERMYRKSIQKKPRAISAAKERRGVKVLGIILGCFTVCWTPFFLMYVIVQFCTTCAINPHIEMFITWLGYSNSAMNPIIYTVFNRDYQIALKRLFIKTDKLPT